MQKNIDLKRIALAGVYSVKGLVAAFRHETAFRQEVVLAVIALLVTLLMDVSRAERALLTMVTILVLIVELLNSAIEAIVDRIGPEIHELSGRAKDMGSAAVMMSLGLWIYVWADIVLFGVLLAG